MSDASSPPVSRRVVRRDPISRGRTLVIAHTTADDVDRLAAHYDALSRDDRYRRFFSYRVPDRTFFEEMVDLPERGGASLIALVIEPDGTELVAGEASYTRLTDGNAELAITVGPHHRGWLGHALIDALVEVAADAGVPNLEALVLGDNRAMISLARSRGYVLMGDSEPSVLHVMISTSGPTPTWPPATTRPKVLVEVPGGRWHAAEAADAAGLEVLACPGPGHSGSDCPVLDGRPCPLAAEADAVVVLPPPGDEDWHEVLAAHAELHPGVPVFVERRGHDAPLPEGVTDLPCDDRTVVMSILPRVRDHGAEHRDDHRAGEEGDG